MDWWTIFSDGTNWCNLSTLWFLCLREVNGVHWKASWQQLPLGALSVFYSLNKLALSFLTFACVCCQRQCEWLRFPKKEQGCVDSSVIVTLVLLPAIWSKLDKACLLQLGLKWGEMFNTTGSAQTQDGALLRYLGQADPPGTD